MFPIDGLADETATLSKLLNRGFCQNYMAKTRGGELVLKDFRKY